MQNIRDSPVSLFLQSSLATPQLSQLTLWSVQRRTSGSDASPTRVVLDS